MEYFLVLFFILLFFFVIFLFEGTKLENLYLYRDGNLSDLVGDYFSIYDFIDAHVGFSFFFL